MLYIVRHGETSFNKRGLMCGNINAHLTESGKLVALALGDKLSFVKFDAAFRSPMYRTEETISCILQKNPFPVAVTVDPRIRERDYGYLEGETHKTQPEFNMRDVYKRQVTTKDKRAAVMESVNARHGVRSESGAVVLALPVEEIAKLS